MKPSYLLLIFSVLLYGQVVFANTDTFSVSTCTIISTLSVGARGVEVECLQKKLGLVADGSFGPITKAAVMNFQRSHSLMADGIIGFFSRKAIISNFITSNGNYPDGCNSNAGYSIRTGAKCDGTSKVGILSPNTGNADPAPITSNINILQSPSVSPNNSANSNPNLVNLDKFINIVVAVSKKNGKSDAEQKLIVDSLRSAVMTSNIDYNQEFKNMLLREASVSLNTKSSPIATLNKFATKLLSFLGIDPSIAQASTGLPFGGALVASFYCAVSNNWMIAVEPLAPNYVALLSYTPGTQGFASHNIPFTRFLLGTYVTGGVCSYGYVNIPTEGTISPMTGSSAL